MSKTLTEIAQIVSKVEDDLYDKADEVIALKMRVSKLESALRGMLNHSCVADAGEDMKEPEDHEAERQARALLEPPR